MRVNQVMVFVDAGSGTIQFFETLKRLAAFANISPASSYFVEPPNRDHDVIFFSAWAIRSFALASCDMTCTALRQAYTVLHTFCESVTCTDPGFLLACSPETLAARFRLSTLAGSMMDGSFFLF